VKAICEIQIGSTFVQSSTLQEPTMTDWTTKPKIAAASGVLGLLLGMGAGGQADAESSDKVSKQARAALVQQAEAKADERVHEAVTDAEQSEEAAIDRAVTDALEAEKSKRKRLIKAAVAKAVDKVKASSPKPKTVADTSDTSTDPRFDTCGAANAAGYGNYQRGSDPEYNWYQDRDNDGSVCE
jgi:hypothetical protein